MERFIKGDIVVLPFPYSDLSASKKRPALVIANVGKSELLLCQITSQEKYDHYAISLVKEDYDSGYLKKSSYIRPNKIFTADMEIIKYKVGSIKKNKLLEVIDKIVQIVSK